MSRATISGDFQLALAACSLYVRLMRPVTSESFGLLIAYLIPGLIVLWGLSQFIPELRTWIGTADNECQTFGGFLNLTVASVGAGLTASTVRWVVIDPIHHWTGVKRPIWDFESLHARTSAFEVLIEIHYRYYQFYANSLVAILFATLARFSMAGADWAEAGVSVGLSALFFAGSRDTLGKYYSRVAAMLKPEAR